MGRLWALAALLQVLLTHTATISASYACLEEQDTNATNEALHIINELHHHGYKFRLVSVDSRTAQEKADPCEVVLALTLEETKCHIVNPEPFTNCELRSEAETKVIAKCNVTMCGGEHPGIKKYTCDTEPGTYTTRYTCETEPGTYTTRYTCDTEPVTYTTHYTCDTEPGTYTTHYTCDTEPGTYTTRYTCDTEPGTYTTSYTCDTEPGTYTTSYTCDTEPGTYTTHYTCDTEPASTVALLHICPDCPILLPLHDPKGLESVKAALEMYNSESNHTSYFKLLEVGRITSQSSPFPAIGRISPYQPHPLSAGGTYRAGVSPPMMVPAPPHSRPPQHNMMFGQSYFVQFAIVETECADSVKTEGKNACKPLCDKEADYGFCQATQLGNGDLNVDCDIYDAQAQSDFRLLLRSDLMPRTQHTTTIIHSTEGTVGTVEVTTLTKVTTTTTTTTTTLLAMANVQTMLVLAMTNVQPMLVQVTTSIQTTHFPQVIKVIIIKAVFIVQAIHTTEVLHTTEYIHTMGTTMNTRKIPRNPPMHPTIL
ncbi:hypothetical protein P4O66_001949 [Electrophorus voltai]|uniref:Cystatin fetuin-A-type domain-containing protein n=1 Tax=Electrophorus voltai TaxID=2609070 RepID=A0AAD8ZUU9_9TELE|nr:hypothetical protein P4O66_001949 [Electrophorus voltai]